MVRLTAFYARTAQPNHDPAQALLRDYAILRVFMAHGFTPDAWVDATIPDHLPGTLRWDMPITQLEPPVQAELARIAPLYTAELLTLPEAQEPR